MGEGRDRDRKLTRARSLGLADGCGCVSRFGWGCAWVLVGGVSGAWLPVVLLRLRVAVAWGVVLVVRCEEDFGEGPWVEGEGGPCEGGSGVGEGDEAGEPVSRGVVWGGGGGRVVCCKHTLGCRGQPECGQGVMLGHCKVAGDNHRLCAPVLGMSVQDTGLYFKRFESALG